MKSKSKKASKKNEKLWWKIGVAILVLIGAWCVWKTYYFDGILLFIIAGLCWQEKIK